MIELELKQEVWLKNEFRKYFPHVCISRDIEQRKYDSYPIEIFEKYVKFAENGQTLTLPHHLQCPYESENENNLKPKTKIGLDIPAMVADENGPLFNMINNIEYVEEIKEKVKKEIFSIFGYLLEKKYGHELEAIETRFSEEFQKYHPGYSYTENVTELFFDRLSINNPVEYNPKKRTFSWDYTTNLNRMFWHKANNIPDAYMLFTRSVYNLRLFGAQNHINEKGFIKLKIALYDYLFKNNLFYKKISNEQNSDKARYQNKITGQCYFATDFISMFGKMVEKELAAKVGKDNYSIKTDLIQKINDKSYEKELVKQEKKEILPKTITSMEQTIRNNYRTFYNRIDFKAIDADSKIRIENAKSISDYVKVMYELLYSGCAIPNKNDILNVLQKNLKEIIYLYYWQSHTLSINNQSHSSEDNKYSLEDTELNPIFDIPSKTSPEDKVTIDTFIARIKNKNPEESINEYVNYLKYLRRCNYFIPLKTIAKIKEKKSIQNILERSFLHYRKIRGNIDNNNLADIEKLHNKKLRKYLHDNKEETVN